jgi:hypothetical protein
VGDIEPITLPIGAKTTVHVPVGVASGYHVQANPAANKFLIPLELQLDDVDGLELGDPVYPRGQPYRLEGTTEDLLTYGGELEILVALEATGTAQLGEQRVNGTLHYQTCDSRMCFFPSSAPVRFTVTVVDRRR